MVSITQSLQIAILHVLMATIVCQQVVRPFIKSYLAHLVQALPLIKGVSVVIYVEQVQWTLVKLEHQHKEII